MMGKQAEEAMSKPADVWASTEDAGVFRYNGQTWTQYTTTDGLLSNVVFDIGGGSDGSIWFATDSGASRLSAEQSAGQ